MRWGVVVKLIRRRHGGDRRMRGHEQVMPKQRQDDEQPWSQSD
jgi:hypothetical protein